MALGAMGLAAGVGIAVTVAALEQTPGCGSHTPGMRCLSRMTSLAIQVFMFARQPEGGPGMVVVPVTIQASGAYWFKFDGLNLFAILCHADTGVAFGTGHGTVNPVQFKAGAAMIEGFDLFKGVKILVAGFAVSSQLSPVKIFVTVRALSGNRPVADGFAGPGGESASGSVMAFYAIHPGVFACQRVAGAGIVIEVQERTLKAFGDVACFAGILKLAQVNIVVTGGAAHVQGFIVHGSGFSQWFMAFVAFDLPVFPGQRVAGIIMIQRHFIKTQYHVAGGAIFFELSFVRVAAVAIGAFGKRHFFMFAARRVAFGAGQAPVLAFQGVACPAVVEGGYFAPGGFVMAARTGLVKRWLVRVRMTIGAAFETQTFPLFILFARFDFMALLTFHRLVFAFEGKSGFVMVEGGFSHRERCVYVMAFVAGLAQLAVVNVFMTGDAAGVFQQVRERKLAGQSVRRFVAALAIGDRLVQAGQGVSGFIVIEVFAFEFDQLEIFAMVLGVATDTFVLFIFMKTGARCDAGGKVLMTLQAFGGIGFFPFGVTFGAIVHTGVLSMNFTQFSR